MPLATIESARVWAFERLHSTGMVSRMTLDEAMTSADRLAQWALVGSMSPDARPELAAIHARFDSVDRALKSLSRKLRAEMETGFAELRDTFKKSGDDTMVVLADFLAVAEQNESTAGSVRDALAGLRAELLVAKEALDNGSDAELQAVLDRLKNADALTKQVLNNTPVAGEPIPPPAEPAPEPTPEPVAEPAPEPVPEQPAEPTPTPAPAPTDPAAQ